MLAEYRVSRALAFYMLCYKAVSTCAVLPSDGNLSGRTKRAASLFEDLYRATMQTMMDSRNSRKSYRRLTPITYDSTHSVRS
jgi:hypothetical protein